MIIDVLKAVSTKSTAPKRMALFSEYFTRIAHKESGDKCRYPHNAD
jgi:hypothetical protein